MEFTMSAKVWKHSLPGSENRGWLGLSTLVHFIGKETSISSAKPALLVAEELVGHLDVLNQ